MKRKQGKIGQIVQKQGTFQVFLFHVRLNFLPLFGRLISSARGRYWPKYLPLRPLHPHSESQNETLGLLLVDWIKIQKKIVVTPGQSHRLFEAKR